MFSDLTDPGYGQHETEGDEEKDQMTVVNMIISKGFLLGDALRW